MSSLRKIKNLIFNREDREGASLISVIIGVGFLTAVGLVLLVVSSNYLSTIAVDTSSSDNFYQAEGILDEVKTGLLEYAGDASEKAYEDTLKDYTKITSSVKKAFAKQYISEIASKITGFAYTWNDSKLGVVQAANIDKLKDLTKIPDAVEVKGGGNLFFVIDEVGSDSYSLTIKNVLVDYTDSLNYRSTINTDIELVVPDYNFEGDSTMDELPGYLSISDRHMEISGNLHNADNLTGNIYTGYKNTSSGKDNMPGLIVNSQNDVNINSDMFISRGGVDVYSGANVNISGETAVSATSSVKNPGEFYAKEINIKPVGTAASKLATLFSMNENAYIQNDLNISDNNSVVSLKGKYYGYSYNEENTSSVTASRSDYSSAILINGLNTTLLTDDLDKMILAGRAFVSRVDDGGNKADFSDIMTGESLAVKSNQIGYLLPDIYFVSNDKKIDSDTLRHNPVLRADYENNTVDVDLTALKASDIWPYLDPNEPYTCNYIYKDPGYVYYYLKFKSEQSANEYFQKYYAGTFTDSDSENVNNKDMITNRAKAYISTTDVTGMKLSANLYLIAGSIIHNYYATSGSLVQNANYFDSTGSPKPDLLADGRKIGIDYVGRQLSLLPSGSTGSMRLVPNTNELVDKKLIDFSKLSTAISKTDPSTGATVVETPNDYVVDASSVKKGIIVSAGDVNVKSDFKGLIIAKGKVNVSLGGLNLQSDIVQTSALLDFIKSDEELAKIFRSYSGSKKPDPSDLSQCFKYRNWIKNES